MIEKVKLLKNADNELRNVINDIYRTEAKDGNVYLHRFRDLITSNDILKAMLSKYNSAIGIDDFLILNERVAKTKCIGAYNIPKDKQLHISYILATLEYLCSIEDLRFVFYYFDREKTYDRAIQAGLKKLISPLYTLLNDKLKNEIESNENKLLPQIQVGRDFFVGDNNTSKTNIKKSEKTNIPIYKKEGFMGGVFTGIISGLLVWAITELIKFLFWA